MKVSCLGQAGSYSQQAVYERFRKVESVSCESFEAVFDAVVSGQCDLGMIPIENSLTGSIHENYDLLLRHDLFIVGEHILRVRHCLIGFPGVKKEEIRRVISHPQALGQCAGYLRRLNASLERSDALSLSKGRRVKAEPAADTAGGVALLKSTGERTTAAIASRRAAEIYEMEILDENIEDDPQNYTRFLVIAPQPVVPDGKAKTSIVFTLPNQTGMLFKAIGAFAQRGIDLTKVESRPLVGKPWDYLFYLDFTGASHETHVQKALVELGEFAPMLRVLGSYPRFKF